MNGADHFLQLDQPEVFNSYLIQFHGELLKQF